MATDTGARGPQVEVVPLLFSLLEVETVATRDVAATFGVDPDAVDIAFSAAADVGYVELNEPNLYTITEAGRQAASTRGGGRPHPVGRYLSRKALLETPEQFGHAGE